MGCTLRQADARCVDVDATVKGSLNLQPLQEPALTLCDVDRATQIARTRPPELDFRPLDSEPYGVGLPGRAPVRAGMRRPPLIPHP